MTQHNLSITKNNNNQIKNKYNQPKFLMWSSVFIGGRTRQFYARTRKRRTIKRNGTVVLSDLLIIAQSDTSVQVTWMGKHCLRRNAHLYIYQMDMLYYLSFVLLIIQFGQFHWLLMLDTIHLWQLHLVVVWFTNNFFLAFIG